MADASHIWIACPNCRSRSRFVRSHENKQRRCPQCASLLPDPAPDDLADFDDADLQLTPASPQPTASPGEQAPKDTLSPSGFASQQAPRQAPSVRHTARPSNTSPAKKPPPAKSPLLNDDVKVPDSWVAPPKDASLGWAFFYNTLSYAWNGNALAQWLTLSLGSMVFSFVALYSAAALNSGGMYGGVAGGLFGMVAIMIFFFIASYGAACFLDIVINTAYNLDKADDWPDPDWRERLWQLWRVGYLFALSAVIAAGVGLLLPWASNAQRLLFFTTVVLVFPILVLSALEANSFLMPFSTRVLASLATSAGAWVVFYAVSATMLAAWGLAVPKIYAKFGGLSLLVACPLEAALVFTYGRLIGRLAWCIIRQTGTRTFAQPPRSER